MLSVDCAALPRDVRDIELPADGHLLFFSDIEYPPDSSAVLHLVRNWRTADGSNDAARGNPGCAVPYSAAGSAAKSTCTAGSTWIVRLA